MLGRSGVRAPACTRQASVACPCNVTPSAPRAACVAVRASAKPSSSPKPSAKPAGSYKINEIPGNGVWEDGIPPVMGAHLMASGTVAPISTSKGAGMDVYPPKVAYYGEEGDIMALLHATPAAAGNSLAKAVIEASQAAIKAKGSFTLVLSGGSLIDALGSLVGSPAEIQWDKFHVFWVDERVVPHTSADSNYGAASAKLLSRVPIPLSQIYAIGEGMTAREAAVNYEGRLVALPPSVLPRNEAGLPVFDLMLLGVGPDGHVASLFPHRGTLSMDEERWVLPIENSPKPPPLRITMSMPVINASKEVVFLALGEGKAEVVQRTLEVQALPGALPAQLVRCSGRVRWLLDVPSAQHLNIAEWDDPKTWPRSVVPK